MFERFWSSDRSILGHMSDEDDGFLHFFCYVHTHLCHNTYLWDTSGWSLDRARWQDREWVNNNNIRIRAFYRNNNRVKIWLRNNIYSLISYTESMCTSRYLSNMLFSTHVENMGICFWVLCIPLCHLEGKGGFTYSWLSREEYEWTRRESPTENTVQLTRHAHISLDSWGIAFVVNLCCFENLSLSYLWFSIFEFWLSERVPLTTSRTLPCPLRRCCRTIGTDKHNSRG